MSYRYKVTRAAVRRDLVGRSMDLGTGRRRARRYARQEIRTMETSPGWIRTPASFFSDDDYEGGF